MKRLISILATTVAIVASLMSAPQASAQKYIADAVFTDHILATDNSSFATESRHLKGTISAMREKGHKIVEIPNGEEVRFVKLTRTPSDKKNENLAAQIVYKGETLYCYAKDLKFSDKNPKGTKDALKDIDFSPNSINIEYKDAKGNDAMSLINTLDRHSDEARELYSYKYPAAAGIMLVLSYIFIGICALLKKGNPNAVKKIFFVLSFLLATAALLAMIYVEVKLYARIGGDVTWWFNTDYFPKKTCAWRCIPFVIFVVLQVISGILYATLLPPRKKGDKSVSGLGALICVVLTFIPALIGAYYLTIKMQGIDMDVITLEQASHGFTTMIGLTAAIMCVIPIIIYTVNCGLPGIPGGIVLTAYWIGTAILIILVFKAIVRLVFVIIAPLVVAVGTAVGGAIVISGAMSASDNKSSGSSGSLSAPTPKMVWKDMAGNEHVSGVDAEAANRRILERKMENQ